MICENAFSAHGNSWAKAAKHQVTSFRIELPAGKVLSFYPSIFSEAGSHQLFAAALIVFMTNR